MKKHLFLTIALLCAIAQGARADYVTDIVVIGHDSERQLGFLADSYRGAGWICLDRDLNDGAGGHYIYLVYKTNASPQNSGTPITDLYLWSGNNPGPASFTHNGRTYYRVGADGDSDFTSRSGDLNCNAGGNWIHLYYTKDHYDTPHRFVTGITINGDYAGSLGENGGSTPGDLNRGAGGDDIFLHFSIGYDNWDAHRASSFSHVKGGTIYIENEAEFGLMAYNVNSGNDYLGTTIVLNTDLDMSAHYWTPIGTNDKHPFRGNFDGNGHTISGIIVNSTGSNNGLFGYVMGSYHSLVGYQGCDFIKNLVLKDSYIKGGDCTGGIVGYIQYSMTLENVVCQADVTGGADVGGIVGTAESCFVGPRDYPTIIRNCLFVSGTISGTGNRAAVIGNILINSNKIIRSNNYYADPASDVGNDYDVRAYPITTSIPEGVTVNYTTSGITYSGIRYAPAGDANLTAKQDYGKYVAVKVNGDEVVGSDGIFSFTIDPAKAESYEVIVTLNDYDFTGSGTEAEPYLIKNKGDWDFFANSLCIGSAPNDFNGVYFKLDAEDITISHRMGTKDDPFCGIFDGGGNKLTLAFGSPESYSDQQCAPFYRLHNATIKNLVIDGSIYSSAQDNAGIAVTATGDNNHIQNCVSSVSIYSDRKGDCTNGGFIGILNTSGTDVYFDGCAFVGELVGANATNWGGFVGWRDYYYRTDANVNRNYVHFTDCVFAPTNFDIATPNGSNSRTFCRATENFTEGAYFNNCYYTEVLQTVDGGKQAYCLTTQPANIGGITTDYGYDIFTTYTNGLGCDGRYYIDCIGFYDNASNAELVADLGTAYSGKQVNVMFTGRTLYKDGNWNTLCLPFDVELEGSLLQGGEARTLNEASFSDGTLTLNFSEPVTKLSAGTPYIIKWNATESTDLIISSADDWNAFAKSVEDGNDYSGKTVELDADINVETMVGTNDHKFKGTFDGKGHTLTFTKNAGEQYCAPFRYVENATIMNLHTAGTITSSKKFGAGIVAHTKGTTTISNCWSSVDINSSVEGDGSHGGIVAYTEENASNTTLSNCLFDGSITGAKTNCCGGLIGWNYGTATLANCVFRPTSITLASENNATFSRGSKVVVTNCYYSEELPGAKGQGEAIGEMSNEDLLAALGSGWKESESKVVPTVTKIPDIISPIFNGVTITAAEPERITPGLSSGTDGDCCVTFTGTYDPVEIGEEGDNTKLYFSSDNTLYWPNGALSINPFRAYFQLNTMAALTRSYKMSFEGNDDETTGILDRVVLDNPSSQGQVADDAWYTLDGRKLDGKPTKKGLYINNGKIIMIK